MVHQFKGLPGQSPVSSMRARQAFITASGDAITIYSLRTEDGSGFKWLFGGSLRGESVDGYYDELRMTGWYSAMSGKEKATKDEITRAKEFARSGSFGKS